MLTVCRFALLAGLAAPGLVWSQEREGLRQPASVPLELATALIGAGGFGTTGDPQIMVGALPDWVSSRVYVPSGARVLGAALAGSSVVGVLQIPTDADTVLRHLEQGLIERGWKAPPVRTGYGGGFRPPRGASLPGFTERPTLCRDQQTISFWVTRQQALATTIVFRLGGGGPNVCSAPRGMTEPLRQSPFPTLYNPEGTDMFSAQECFRSGMSSTQAQFRSSLAADAILEHYAKQLQDSGWTRAGGSASTISGRSWTRGDTATGPRRLMLTVEVPPHNPACRTVRMEVETRRDQ